MERLDDEEEVHMSLTTETDDDDVSGMMSVDEDDMMIMELRQAVVLCDEAVEEAMILHRARAARLSMTVAVAFLCTATTNSTACLAVCSLFGPFVHSISTPFGIGCNYVRRKEVRTDTSLCGA